MVAPVLPARWVITPADNTDDADVFPFLRGQSFLLMKTPQWSSKVDISVSGVERRRALWSYPIWRFRMAHEFLRDSASTLELQRLVTFFNSKSGSTTGFFYLDRTDNLATDVQFGTGDGVTTTYQLVRRSTIGGITFAEPVRGFNGTPVIKVNGTPTGAFTVGAFGLITFTVAPAAAAVLTWSGNYFFLCRFDADELEGLSQIANGFWASGQFDFRTYKP